SAASARSAAGTTSTPRDAARRRGRSTAAWPSGRASAAGCPRHRRRGGLSEPGRAVHFITRERIHVDRIATAWAIRRFVDAGATFQFVPRTRDVSGVTGIPFDIRGAELGHRGGRCTLEALIDKYELTDD